MISDKLLVKLNEQMNYEFYSSKTYLAMAGYCADQSFNGFANFLIVQSEEERQHAMKLFHFMNTMSVRVHIGQIKEPKNQFTSIVEVFEEAYRQEKEVTQRIYDLSDIALNEREHATLNFLKWFIEEQIEEESTFDDIVHRLQRIKEDSHAFFMMDAELGQRNQPNVSV